MGQEKNIRKKQKDREAHKNKSLEGMRKKDEKEKSWQGEKIAEFKKEQRQNGGDDGGDSSADDDAAYYEQEVGEKRDKKSKKKRKTQIFNTEGVGPGFKKGSGKDKL